MVGNIIRFLKGRRVSPPRNYKEAQRHQITEWVEGRPWHNPFDPMTGVKNEQDKAHGECCPDFSCCEPDLLNPLGERIEFARSRGFLI